MKSLSRVALVLALAAPLPAQDEASRLVAIGDIHGSLENFTSILKTAGLTGADGKWAAGKTILVQTGDYMDRGTDVRAVLDRLMALESEARQADGRVVVLLGNHEVMNLIGLTRDATPEIFATFADAKSASRRDEEWEDYGTLAESKKADREPIPDILAQSREAWMQAHPLGYAEYRDAIGPRGRYGRWLRSKPMIASINGSIFMHAGIPPADAPAQIDDLNNKVKNEIARIDRFRQRMLDKHLITPSFTLQEMLTVAVAEIDVANAAIKASNSGGRPVDPDKIDMDFLKEAVEALKVDTSILLDNEGPLWYRGYALLPDDETGGPLAALLAKYNARRFVVGHTPNQSYRIASRFGGRVLVIDTGMLKEYYGGRPSALEVKGSELTAIYEDGRVPLGGASTGVPAAWLWNHSTVLRSPSSSFTVGR